MITILLIILVLMLVGAFPSWPYSRSWGYYPSGGLGLVVIILVILLLMGRILAKHREPRARRLRAERECPCGRCR